MADTSAIATKPTISTDEDDHDRFEHGGEALDPELELTVEVLGRHLELLVERTGLFADLEHLPGSAGEQLGLDQRLGEAGTLQHLLAGDVELLSVDDVGDGLGRGLHGGRHRDAGDAASCRARRRTVRGSRTR